jgi:LmbE family N-acetylglucosaminyl deacetylase
MSSATDPQKILMVFAHADDETLLAGALIWKLAQDGHEIALLCLAPGDPDRESRLRKACDVLGISSVTTFRYKEGPMWPDEKVDEHRPFVVHDLTSQLSTAPTSDIAGRIGGRILEFEPDIVITHSPYGDYGHPDHATANRATMLAAANTGAYGVAGIRLYALEWSGLMLWLSRRMLKIGGRSVQKMGPDGRFNFELASRSPQGKNLSIDVARGLGKRRLASHWYSKEISQGPLPMRLLEVLPLWIQRVFLGKARLKRVVAPDDFIDDGRL